MPPRSLLPPGSYDVFGVKLTPLTCDELIAAVAAHVTGRRACTIASQNVHGIEVARSDADFRALHRDRDTIVHLDGMPLVALCRLAGLPVGVRHRVTLVDLIWPLLETASAAGWRVFYLGSSPAVVAAARGAIAARLPALALACHDGYFALDDAQANAAILAQIERFAPQLVLVGMGMGRQEQWIVRHRAALSPCVVVTVGACMEYVAGRVATPPRWMGRHGLEWLFRLAESPRRFWRRYLVEPWSVLAYLAGAMFRGGER